MATGTKTPTPESPANPFDDVKKMMEQFKMPGVDMSAIVSASQKDIQALMEANKATYESMQAIARKQTEMFAEAMQGMQQAAKGAAGAVGDPTKQGEAVRKAFEKTLADMKELAEMARSSQTDVMALITKRANEHVEEIRQMMQLK